MPQRVKDNGVDWENCAALDIREYIYNMPTVMAAADVISRYSEGFVSKCGYSRVAAIMAANAPGCLQTLRSKHKGMFILVDGYDYTNSNAKNCALAFDRLGYGAAVCAGTSITAAWQEDTMQQRQFVSLAVESAQRMKKNLTRYVTIL